MTLLFLPRSQSSSHKTPREKQRHSWPRDLSLCHPKPSNVSGQWSLSSCLGRSRLTPQSVINPKCSEAAGEHGTQVLALAGENESAGTQFCPVLYRYLPPHMKCSCLGSAANEEEHHVEIQAGSCLHSPEALKTNVKWGK